MEPVQSPATNSQRLRVLIADDARDARRGTRLMLSLNPDLEVVAIAQNGLEAVEMAQTHRPDLVIIDINMPEMDGITAIHTMRTFLSKAAFIVISADRDQQTIRSASAAGAQEYLTKPFTVEELEEAIKRSVQVLEARRQTKPIGPKTTESQEDLLNKANQIAQSRQTNDEAIQVLEMLAADPSCALRWLRILGMIYIIRQEWSKLRELATRLETQSPS
jgi:YesN/AraC family two-component response regulator